MRPLLPLLFVAAILASPAVAWAGDPAAARAQLEAGYALKEQGKYNEAVPHLLESLRLDPQLKTLTNLADCEEHIGQLVDAQQHWVMARDRAGMEQNSKIKATLEARIAALEARMPKLVIRLAGDAPAATEVARDGTVLGPISLGTPLPLNPGSHTVVVRAPGRSEQTFTVTLSEREQQELEVRSGAANLTAPTSQADRPVAPVSAWGTQKTAAVVAGGVAVVGLGLGTGFGLATGSKWSSAQQECGKGCSSTSPAQSDRSTALTDATVSNVAFVVAGAALAGAVVLWVTAPHQHERPRALDAVRLVPTLGRGAGGLVLTGQL
jgi:hypothetical protein